MKVNLNIKNTTRTYQKLNWPIIAAFAMTIVISVIWLYNTHTTRSEYTEKINDYEAMIALIKSRVDKNVSVKKVIENKQFINRENLNQLNGRINYLGRFTGQKSHLHPFFQALEDSMTSEIIITKLYNVEKNKEFYIEGTGASADNITEFIKRLQSQKCFSGVDLKQILGDNMSTQKTLKFLATFSFENAAMLEIADQSGKPDEKTVRQ